jgi:hypothetical protein
MLSGAMSATRLMFGSPLSGFHELNCVSVVLCRAALDEAEQKNIMFKQEVEKLRLQWRDAQNNYERQVLLQADTIRELTVTSDKLSKLENLEKALHGRAEKAEAELVCCLISAILLTSFTHSRSVSFASCSLAVTWTNPPLLHNKGIVRLFCKSVTANATRPVRCC